MACSKGQKRPKAPESGQAICDLADAELFPGAGVALPPTLPSTSTSPVLTAMTHGPAPPTSPAPELEVGPGGSERHSILKALSGFWPQPLPQPRQRAETDAEDPMSDPEHIFRNSSMVVRTDEPTSIIALALK